MVFIAQNLSAQEWHPVPLVSSEIKNEGNYGGEGCQFIQAIEIDKNNGTFLLMGTDVGGIYRSTDGGEMWEPCNIGYNPRGNCGFTIDPNNSSRALAIGANSTAHQSHGIYLSTNQAESWKHVYAESGYNGYRGYKDKVDFDGTSYDPDSGYSMIAYWSNPAGGLFRSEDGGETWNEANEDFGDCILKTDPGNGTLYMGNEQGFYISTDGGITLTQTFSGKIRDLQVSFRDSGMVWMTTPDALYVSTNSGENFEMVADANYPGNVVTLAVSPANTDHLVVCQKNGDYQLPVYYSTDGGVNWNLSRRDNSNAFMPFNGRPQKFAWHPADENKLWALGGDWITSSQDAGELFKWDANGINAILVGGFFNFNLQHPEILYVASQDYNGAVTFNGGETWKYCNASGLGWGGFTYGAYAASTDILVTQVSQSWGADGVLTISRNGGDSFTKSSFTCSGHDVACGDPKDPDVIYFSNWRSTDLGETWNEMPDCDGVFTANLQEENEVYGAEGTAVLRSDDYGASWQTVINLPGIVKDIAVDPGHNRLYIVIDNNRLFIYEERGYQEITSYLPKDQYGNITVNSVAVDPVETEVVYAAGPRNVYATDAAVMRSRDAGLSWEILTRNKRIASEQTGKDGAREAFAIRVNPDTRELWAAGGCYGIWKIAAPDSVPFSFPVVRMNKTRCVLGENESLQLELIITFDTDKVVEWRSADNRIAEVNQNGKVTGISKGNTIIYAKLLLTGDEVSSTILVTGTRAPFMDSNRHIPGKIEAEHFDEGGEEVAYHDSETVNDGGQYRTGESVDIEISSQGGYNVGWTSAGEWLAYTVEVKESGIYDVEASIASESAGGKFSVTFPGEEKTVADFEFGATGGWQTWELVKESGIELVSGIKDMRIDIIEDGFNIDYLIFSEHIPENIREETTEQRISIYPNPLIYNDLYIRNNNIEHPVLLKIYDITGKMIFESEIISDGSLQLNRSRFSKGVYIIRSEYPEYVDCTLLTVD